MKQISIVTLLALTLAASAAQAQLSQNLSVGNPVALSLGNSITARPPGTDAIHYNPAGLALLKNEYKQYKLQTAFFRHEGSVSGQAPGVPFVPSEQPEHRQDPILLGETSRPGVFVAGAATGPETIDDSIAQGHAAAMSVLSGMQALGKTA